MAMLSNNGTATRIVNAIRDGRTLRLPVAPGAQVAADEFAMTASLKAAIKAGSIKIGGATKPNERSDRAARYAELVEGLTGDDLTDGKPKVDALNALLDDSEDRFTAAERDELHAAQA